MQDLLPDIRFQGIAITVLQEATKAYLIGLLKDMNLCAIYTKQVTVLPHDMQLA